MGTVPCFLLGFDRRSGPDTAVPRGLLLVVPALLFLPQVNASDGPSSRIGARMIYDPAGQRVLLFGGSHYDNGYTLYNDDILAAIQQMALDACQRASASIAPYDARYLDALIDELAAQLEDSFQAALESWRKFRDAFQPATGRWKSQR